jgi:flagellar hook-associated protein 1 FlgK
MSSTFFGFNISRSGLFASQRALNVTSHNIANANTEGYTRQRLDIKQSTPMALSGGQGMLGTGVTTENITQIRDEFLDFKFRGENMTYGEWEVKAETLETIEAIFNEPSESGIRTVMDQFFSSLQELNTSPESLTVRALVRQRGIALAKNINHMAEQFKKLQSDIDFEIKTTVDQINGYSDQIRKLNELIYNAELDGSKANDLRDQRNLVLDKLSKLVNIDYYEDNQNRFHVLINGKSLVSHFRNNKLAYQQRTSKLHPDDAENLSDLMWEDGSTFNPKSGKIKGLIDMRDNINGSDKGIPYYMERLNNFTDVLAEQLNRIHKTGYDLNANTGTNLFTINGMSTAEYENYLLTEGLEGGPAVDVTSFVLSGTSSSLTEEENNEIIRNNINSKLSEPTYQGKTIKLLSNGRYVITDKISASELTISADVDGDLDKIAASISPEGVPGDGNNAKKMGSVRNDVSLYEWGSPDDYVKSLISNLGVDTQEAIRMKDNQTVLLHQVDINRQSISGVSLDEEMAEMVKFQHSFNANARMITAFDEMIDTIVNKLGLVGR